MRRAAEAASRPWVQGAVEANVVARGRDLALLR
jgi:hypothetical protein